MLVPFEITDTLGFLRETRTPRDWLGVPALLIQLIGHAIVWPVNAEYERRLVRRYLAKVAVEEAALAAQMEEESRLNRKRRLDLLASLSPARRMEFADKEMLGEKFGTFDALRWR